MTEITEYKGSILLPRPLPRTRLIDPIAFFVALIGGPLLFTLGSFWAFFIPVFALAFGGPLYLAFGTPVLLWMMGRNEQKPSDLAFYALLTLFALGALALGFGLLTGEEDILGIAAGYTFFGVIFAPAWAATFGWLYLKLRRPFYAPPL